MISKVKKLNAEGWGKNKKQKTKEELYFGENSERQRFLGKEEEEKDNQEQNQRSQKATGK